MTFVKGCVPWNKGKPATRGAFKKGHKPIGNYFRKGNKLWDNEKNKNTRFKKGKKHINWKGGITPKFHLIRTSTEYKLWRTSVFKRDKYTCIWCGDNRGGNLEADHIKPFALFPELRFAIDNGRTLCKKCHKTTNTFGAKLLYSSLVGEKKKQQPAPQFNQISN